MTQENAKNPPMKLDVIISDSDGCMSYSVDGVNHTWQDKMVQDAIRNFRHRWGLTKSVNWTKMTKELFFEYLKNINLGDPFTVSVEYKFRCTEPIKKEAVEEVIGQLFYLDWHFSPSTAQAIFGYEQGFRLYENYKRADRNFFVFWSRLDGNEKDKVIDWISERARVTKD